MSKSSALFERAQKVMAGGVCAGGRYNHAKGGPTLLDHAEGCHVYDVDGREYIDFHCGSGGILFGWKNPQIEEAILKGVERGFFMNFDTEDTLEFAELFTKLIPTAEKIRITNSGSEATMAALRIARAYTGKNLIIKMDGHFHGMHEMIWFNDMYGTDLDENAETKKVVPDSKGFPKGAGDNVRLIEFNNINAVKHAFEKYRGEIAAIIMEPVSYDLGCMPSTKEYMQEVRKLCDQEGILLIYDEVITGLRFRPGSAQVYYDVQPDLSTFAKAVANGFSLAVIAGKGEIMDMCNPVGPVAISGTSSGNFLSVLAAKECLKMASAPGFYDDIEKKEALFAEGVNDLFRKHKIPGHIRTQGAQFGFYFGYEDPQIDYNLHDTVTNFAPEMYPKFVKEALAEGLHFYCGGAYPFPHHCGFTSMHTQQDLTIALEKMDRIFAKLK